MDVGFQETKHEKRNSCILCDCNQDNNQIKKKLWEIFSLLCHF